MDIIFLGIVINCIFRFILGVELSNKFAAANASASALNVSPNWIITWLNISGENALHNDVIVVVPVNIKHGKHQCTFIPTMVDRLCLKTKSVYMP